MITTKGADTITTLSNGKHRAHRLGLYWVGDYSAHGIAERAIRIASSPNAPSDHRGVYDGGVRTSEPVRTQHLKATVHAVFGDQPLSEDTVRRTILAGEPCKLVGGWPVAQLQTITR